MNQQFLIPANSKRSMLILSLFTPVDLIIFGVGAGLTSLLLMVIHTENLRDIMVILTPVLISTFMVIPVPNHRNIWQLTANVYHYFSHRRKYYWRGWCMLHGEETKGK